LFGSANPQYDIEDVNQGYQDLREGKNIRGVVIHG
jgi:Zn-dependent alcohol dehydrogenase